MVSTTEAETTDEPHLLPRRPLCFQLPASEISVKQEAQDPHSEDDDPDPPEGQGPNPPKLPTENIEAPKAGTNCLTADPAGGYQCLELHCLYDALEAPLQSKREPHPEDHQ